MKPRTLAALGLLLLGSATFAAAPVVKPWTPGRPGAPADSQPASPTRKFVTYINGVADTGQFLPDTALLGSMDERQFTVREFRQAWFASYALDRPAQDSAGRFQFLTAMADKEVLARLARQVDRPFNFEDRAALREHTQRVLSNMTFQRLVADSATPSEAELRHAYEQSQSVLHFQHILTAVRADAERAREDLAAGRITWPQAVVRYSIAKQDSGPDGEMGWMQRAEFPIDRASGLWELRNGQLSEVFLGRDGFQLVRLLGRKPNPMPPYERVRMILVNQLAPLKISQRVEELRVILRERAGVTYDSAGIAWAAARFATALPVRSRPDGTPVLDLSGPLPRVTVADTGRVLARWKEGSFTMGRFLSVYRTLPPIQRPEVHTFESLRSFLDGSLLEPYMAELGSERGIGRDPVAIAQMEKKREELTVQHLFQDSVEARVWITPAERQQYYQSRLRDFWSYQGVRYAAIPRGTKAAADSLADRLRRGEKAEAILRADSLRLGHSTGSIRFEREDQPGPFFAALSQDLKPGEVTVEGPVKDGEFAVIQKLEHDPGRQLRYDEVEKIVDESLQNIKAERMLKEFIARHRVGHRIVLHPERLMLVRLTDPLDD
jgi:parvulin-like peptidyl-prolyl isomerase